MTQSQIDPNKVAVSFGLNAFEQSILKDIYSKEIFYVDDPSFQDKDAELNIFGIEVPNAPHWKDFLDYDTFRKSVKTKAEKEKAILTPENEKILFQQFNYSRFRVSELKKIITQETLTEENIKNMISWFKKSLVARTKIVEYNLRLIATMINKFHHFNLDLDELYSEGQNVLLLAIEKFDHNKAKFSTYAYWSLLNAFNRINKDRSKRNEMMPESVEENEESQNAIKHEDDNVYCIEAITKIIEQNLANLNDNEMNIVQARYLKCEKRPSVADVSDKLNIKKHNISKFENSAFAKIKRVLERDFLR